MVSTESFLFIETYDDELWRTDGTAEGTLKLMDYSLEAYPIIWSFFDVADTSYFWAGSERGKELWRTQGTAETTVRVPDLFQRSDSEQFLVRPWNGKLFLVDDNRLFESNGTVEGTIEVSTDPYTSLFVLNAMTAGQGVLTSIRSVQLGEELFLVTPDVESNPRVFDFSVSEANGRIASVSFTFTENVFASLSASDLLITNELGLAVDTFDTNWTWDELSRTAIWDLTTLSLGDGVYNVELGRDGVFDVNNNSLDGNGDGINGDSFRSVIAIGLPGDIDFNGKVDFGDFLALSANFGSIGEAGWGDGDLNGDRNVDFADFLLLSANFGREKNLAAAAFAASDEWWSP